MSLKYTLVLTTFFFISCVPINSEKGELSFSKADDEAVDLDEGFNFDKDTTRKPASIIDHGTLESSRRQVLYKDNEFIFEKLKNIFGNPNNYLTNNVLNAGHIYGGVCDMYQSLSVNNSGRIFTNSCGNNRYNNIERTESSTVKQGAMFKICTDLIDITVAHISDKYNLNFDKALTEDTIKVMYQMFYPLKLPSEDFFNTAFKMGDFSESNQHHHKLVLSSLCLSPDWQIH